MHPLWLLATCHFQFHYSSLFCKFVKRNSHRVQQLLSWAENVKVNLLTLASTDMLILPCAQSNNKLQQEQVFQLPTCSRGWVRLRCTCTFLCVCECDKQHASVGLVNTPGGGYEMGRCTWSIIIITLIIPSGTVITRWTNKQPPPPPPQKKATLGSGICFPVHLYSCVWRKTWFAAVDATFPQSFTIQALSCPLSMYLYQ